MAGLATALGAYGLARLLGGELVVAAYAAAIFENLGFYGVLAAREIGHDLRVTRGAGLSYGRRGVAGSMARLLTEFGPAEALDTALLRPLSIAVAASALGSVGVVIGKVAADFVFYVPVVATYELRRRVSGSH